jgi:penicillin-binding protein 1A
MIEDRPITIGHWTPRNASGAYMGNIPLRDAFAISSNVAAVRLAQRVGLNNVIRAARDLGITAPIPANDPSIALGTSDVSLIEMTAAYAAIASGRFPVAPNGLAGTQSEDNVFSTFLRRVGTGAPRGDPAFADLRELLHYAVAKGTGHGAELPVMTFGKTGTSQDSRDALFIGFAGDLVVGIWVGNDDNRPMAGVSGGGLPARIWHNFMMQALNLHPIPPVVKKAPDQAQPPEDDDSLGGVISGVVGRIRNLFGGH